MGKDISISGMCILNKARATHEKVKAEYEEKMISDPVFAEEQNDRRKRLNNKRAEDGKRRMEFQCSLFKKESNLTCVTISEKTFSPN